MGANVQRNDRELKMHEAYVDVRGVSFVYPGSSAPVLDDASLGARKGAVTCLMGINGCGKSTLIDCILGENRISSGSIIVNGEDAASMRPATLAQKVSFVPQVHERTFPYQVRDVVMMGRTAYRGVLSAPGDEDEAIVDRALAECGVSHLASRPYTQLSGGETQMVLLARALAQQAPFILMDEPTAHLDFKNELFFMETVVRLVREQGAGVLMATHSPNQAFYFEGKGVPTVCALMDRGRVRYCDSPSEVLTPDILRELYGVHTQVASIDVGEGGSLNQLVLVRTEEESSDR